VFGWDAQDLAPWHCHENLLRSPLLRACRAESEPFWATREGLHTRWPNRVTGQIARDTLAAQDSPASAIVVPVHLPFGQVGAAILTGKDGGDTDLSVPFARVIEALAAPIERFVRGYVMVTRDERYLPDDCLLTSREIECLDRAWQDRLRDRHHPRLQPCRGALSRHPRLHQAGRGKPRAIGVPRGPARPARHSRRLEHFPARQPLRRPARVRSPA
jgi:hypothetical protein